MRFSLPEYVDDANLVAQLADGGSRSISKSAKAAARKIVIGEGSDPKKIGG